MDQDYVDLYFSADEKVKNDLLRKKIAGRTIVISGIPVREQFSRSFDRLGSRRKFGLANKFTVMLIGRSKDVTKTVIPRLCAN